MRMPLNRLPGLFRLRVPVSCSDDVHVSEVVNVTLENDVAASSVACGCRREAAGGEVKSSGVELLFRGSKPSPVATGGDKPVAGVSVPAGSEGASSTGGEELSVI